MPRTDRNQVYDRDGNLLSEELVEVTDEAVELETDDDRLRQLVDLARTPVEQWTAAQAKTVARLLLRRQLRGELRARVD